MRFQSCCDVWATGNGRRFPRSVAGLGGDVIDIDTMTACSRLDSLRKVRADMNRSGVKVSCWMSISTDRRETIGGSGCKLLSSGEDKTRFQDSSLHCIDKYLNHRAVEQCVMEMQSSRWHRCSPYGHKPASAALLRKKRHPDYRRTSSLYKTFLILHTAHYKFTPSYTTSPTSTPSIQSPTTSTSYCSKSSQVLSCSSSSTTPPLSRQHPTSHVHLGG